MIKRELGFEKKSLIIWCISMVVFMFLGMQKYSAFTGAGSAEMLKILDEMPYVLKAMFGMSSFDVTKIEGYYGMLYFYLVLILAIHALLLGIKMISKDTLDKTAEFLYTKPISRKKILLNKIIVSFIIMILVNLSIYIPASFIMNSYSGSYLIKELILSSIASILVQSIFYFIGLLLGILFNQKKAFYIGLTIFTFTFLFSVTIDVFSQLKIISFLTPFKYADPKLFLNTLNLDVKYIILEVLIIAVLSIISFIKIDSKDMV